jgi:glycosyltransferase involved in cell wall biosynthesis
LGEKTMIVGVFSPAINKCGGAEWVAINIVTALKEHGHQVIVLSDDPLDQNKFMDIFGEKILANQQMVFPLRFFSSTNHHNLYTNALKCLALKSKCQVLVDTFSNAILPGVDSAYFQGFPLLERLRIHLPHLREKIFFSPYQNYKNFSRDNIKTKLLFANSKYSADAIRAELDVEPHILYPSVSNYILNPNNVDLEKQRKNNVATVARINAVKNLQIIPYIAESTNKDISFTIMGLLDSEKTLNSLLKLIKDLNLSERVKILTNVKREQLKSILLSSKVFLHTSINEPFGISIVEAMASGCIPVVHNSGGPKEFVPSNQRFNNVGEAADIVEKAIVDWSPTQARKFSKMAERFGENNFSKQFIDIFDSHFQRRH